MKTSRWQDIYQALTRDPMQIVWRYVWAMVGGFLAMAIFLNTIGYFSTSKTILTWSLFTGCLIGFVVIFSSEYPKRLEDILPTWVRVMSASIISYIFGNICWILLYLFLRQRPVQFSDLTNIIMLGRTSLTLAFLVPQFLKFSVWFNILMSTIIILAPSYLLMLDIFYLNTGFLNGFYITKEMIYQSGLLFAFCMALGANVQELWHYHRKPEKKKKREEVQPNSTIKHRLSDNDDLAEYDYADQSTNSQQQTQP